MSVGLVPGHESVLDLIDYIRERARTIYSIYQEYVNVWRYVAVGLHNISLL